MKEPVMNIDSQTVQLTLTLAEVNQILESLGNQPYVRVFQIVAKIQRQAEDQLSDQPSSRLRATPGAPMPLNGRASGE